MNRNDFEKAVFENIKIKKGSVPSKEECMAVAHHMEYNIRADRRYANNGHLKIPTEDLRQGIVEQIKRHLRANDIKGYVEQYKAYKDCQKNWKLTTSEKNDLEDIAKGRKKVSDFKDKDYLKNLYIKYFNQELLPIIREISWQEKNKLQYHGIWHTEQVALFAIDISVEENMNPLPNLVAAALHDCARKKDFGDVEHAKNCEPIARDFLNGRYSDAGLLSQKDKEQIIYAVTHHNVPPKDKSNVVLNCLQDADSMRLWWERGQTYQPNTFRGKLLSNYCAHPYKQIKYMANMLERMRATMPPPPPSKTANKVLRNIFSGNSGRRY